jgi:hypothetical protein
METHSFERMYKNLKVPIKVAIASNKLSDGHLKYLVQSVNNYRFELKRFIKENLKGVVTNDLPHYFAW